MLESFNNTFEYQRLSPEEQQKKGILARLVGVIADTVNPTRNGRLYNSELWEKVFDDPIVQEKINNKVFVGEFEHPEDGRTSIDPQKIAICLAEMPKKNSKGQLVGVFDVLSTPCGKILKTLLDYGANIGVSSRGEGDLITDFDGKEAVDPNTYQCFCWDAVLTPSVEAARPQLVTESLNGKLSLAESLNRLVEAADEKDKQIMKETIDHISESLDGKGRIFLDKESGDYKIEKSNGTLARSSSGEILTFDTDQDAEEYIVEEIKITHGNSPRNGDYDYYHLGYIDHVNCSATHYLKDNTYQVSTSRPYDDADYTWAKSTDGENWKLIKSGKTVDTLNTDFEDFETVAKTIIAKDSKVKPRMVYEKLDDDLSNSENYLGYSIIFNEENQKFDVYKNNELQQVDFETIDEAHEFIDAQQEVSSNDVGNAESDVIINELQEALRQKTESENKVISLNEQLSASYARESDLQDKLSKANDLAAKLTKSHKRNQSLQEQFNSKSNELETVRKTLDENLSKVRKLQEIQKALKESLTAKTTEVERLNNAIGDLTSKADQLNENLVNLKKDNIQLKNNYSKKIEQSNSLVERYQKIAQKAVDKYIDQNALKLGISSEAFRKRLPQNYSFNDIDSLCEEMQDQKITINRLPFGAMKLNESNPAPRVQISNIQKESILSDQHSQYDDIVDDDLLRLAGF